ncbi:hypothetical protein [Frankia sp. R82]|uniref:hypothetical protein n=1 Tax=Frankia sp. R82 TaxID=2950553 RepID=UPI002043E8D1|nr:hypothetical protein [Frankia sp. R82]MCM3884814.1 hypothetical protein [Frankia sp. R82]
MLIDCDSCVARGVQCASCVLTVMFADAGEAPPPAVRPARDPRRAPAPAGGRSGTDAPSGAGGGGWDAEEQRALRLLGAAGLLPPLEELADSVLERTIHRAAPPRRAG